MATTQSTSTRLVVCGAAIALLVVTANAQQDGPAKPTEKAAPVEARVRVMQSQLSSIEQGIGGVDKKLPRLQQQVKELLEKASSIRPPEAKKEEPEPKPQPQTVEFRPPMFRSAGDKKPSWTFFCKENRVFVVDVKAFAEATKTSIAEAKRKGTDELTAIRQAYAKGRKYPLSLGDCDVVIEDPNERQFGNRISWNPKVLAVAKSGHLGEPLESIRKPGSGYRSYLDKSNPSTSYLQYEVFPDSFPIFREMRTIAWERKYDVNWIPRVAGEPFTSGGGSGGVQ